MGPNLYTHREKKGKDKSKEAEVVERSSDDSGQDWEYVEDDMVTVALDASMRSKLYSLPHLRRRRILSVTFIAVPQRMEKKLDLGAKQAPAVTTRP
jgi:hypothetical protein